MTEPSKEDRLKGLDARIEAAKKGQRPGPRSDEHYSQANLAWRMVIELVAGLGIGFGMGYGIDILFGTLPIFLVIFTLLGLAAGIKVMIATSKEVQGELEAAARRRGDTDEEG